ncbi:hypothetical protein LEP1GSC103_0202 [Leptospira borgpetersenii serovar Javanica str. UI 09931]|nr:hypothetical protein LEP1GSC121_1902 [Leptospira borgpetersenii serovar Castellonis str. 200801910]EMN58224.1 hypothetical protein LEP1GSC090_3941 [Leptospira borgpetersenii serovar Javanica str. MK146]EMO09281.1 hypothetical protein LEP1GSC137_2760 [Leptospira borgpetersenii str. Noumea 25]ENO63334.1 hypothetical protein LEP1GSC191_3456 [Leptospira borgpetersenii serovar Mini str. 201000851]EPG58632.1 hypothetical protein LEP1GSC103_0202 [Leptospira borgpetersenii serovar Javanica str. UI 0
MNSLIPIENFKESYASILLILLKPILFHSIRINFRLNFPIAISKNVLYLK